MTRHIFTRRGLFATTGASLLIAGCGGNLIGPSTPPFQIYLLNPAIGPLVDAPQASWQLAVARADTGQSLDTERIALERGEMMDYFADAQWTDATPILVQSLLVQAFEKSGKIAAVAREAEGLRADYVLETEVRDFAAHYDSENGAPDIVVTIVAKVLSAAHRQVVGTLSASHHARSAQNTVPAVVAAFDQAFGAALEEIVGWTLQTASSLPATGELPSGRRTLRP